MKEKPILFNAEMIMALLDNRKSQTRRVIKRLAGFGEITEFGASDTHGYDWTFRDKHGRWHDISHQRLIEGCPYGKPGDELWVKETFAYNWLWFQEQEIPIDSHEPELFYRATDMYFEETRKKRGIKWRSPWFMPRWASRIQLEITDVRVQRVQEISNEDAQCEGCFGDVDPYWRPTYGDPDSGGYPSFKNSFEFLWDSINSKRGYGWDKNQWVWVVGFEVLNENS